MKIRPLFAILMSVIFAGILAFPKTARPQSDAPAVTGPQYQVVSHVPDNNIKENHYCKDNLFVWEAPTPYTPQYLHFYYWDKKEKKAVFQEVPMDDVKLAVSDPQLNTAPVALSDGTVSPPMVTDVGNDKGQTMWILTVTKAMEGADGFCLDVVPRQKSTPSPQ